MLARYTWRGIGTWGSTSYYKATIRTYGIHYVETLVFFLFVFPHHQGRQRRIESGNAKEMELLPNINYIHRVGTLCEVISEQIVNACPNKIINIHHSFLPAFVGAK